MKEKKADYWTLPYLLSVPFGFLLASIMLRITIFSGPLNDSAGVLFQFWILFSIIITPLFALIIFSLLNIIKNRRITKNLILTYIIIIFFILLALIIYWLQAIFMNK